MRPRNFALVLVLLASFLAAPREARTALPEIHEVPRTPTPIADEQLGRLLPRAHEMLFGVAPGPERLLVAWAHASLETARGTRAFGNNVGNIVVTNDWSGDYYVFRVMERVRRNPDRWIEQGIRFRAYKTPLEGAIDYWRVLAASFASALAKFDAGDARSAARSLCEGGYSTADCATYGRGVEGLYRSLRVDWLHRLGELGTDPHAEDEAMTPSAWEELERTTGVNCCVLETR